MANAGHDVLGSDGGILPPPLLPPLLPLPLLLPPLLGIKNSTGGCHIPSTAAADWWPAAEAWAVVSARYCAVIVDSG
jgi:hypothetical protein